MSDYTNTSIGSGYNTTSAINTELEAVETAVATKVDKSGSTMTGDLDMNSNAILNASTISASVLSLNGELYTDSVGAVTVLPDQAGNSGKHLSTDGATAYWEAVEDVQILPEVFNSVDVATMVARTDVEIGDIVITEHFYSSTRGGATYDVASDAATTTPANGIDILQGVGDRLFILRVDGAINILQGGAKYDGIFDNTAILERLQNRKNTLIFPTNVGSEDYHFSSVPTIGSNLVVITGIKDNFSGVTADQINAWTAGKGGVPRVAELEASHKSLEIIAGTITQQVKVAVGGITASGTTATVSHTAHGYSTSDRIIVADAVETDYNGTFTITVTGVNAYTYTMGGSPTSPATGTPAARKPAQYDWISDGNHIPVGVDTSSPCVATGSQIAVPFTKTYSRVLSVVATPDEALCNAHNLTCGTSVGLSNFIIKAGGSLSGTAIIKWDGAAWSVTHGTGQVLNFEVSESAGVLTITHDYCPGISLDLTPYSSDGIVVPYPAYLQAAGNSSFEVAFIAHGTSIKYVGAPTTSQSFIVTKSYHEGLLLDGSGDSDSLDLSVGNFWFMGLMEV